MLCPHCIYCTMNHQNTAGVGAILPLKDMQTQPKPKNAGIDGATPKRRCKSFKKCRHGRIYNKSTKTPREQMLHSRKRHDPVKKMLKQEILSTNPPKKMEELMFHTRGDKCRPNQDPRNADGATPKHIIGQMARPQKVRAMNRHALGGCQIAEGPRHLYAHFGRGRSHLILTWCNQMGKRST